jgi:FkbM family methyltransferase
MKMALHKRLSRTLRSHLRARVLSRHGIGVVAVARNGTFVVDPRDFNVARQLLEEGEYDWSEITLLASLLNDTSRVVFAGAHVGALLVPIARLARLPHILAYEPSPQNFRALQMNLCLNAINDVVLRNAAVGAHAGVVRFTENRINSGNSRLSEDGEIEVEVTTLDASVPADWEQIDLLVMDVEGSEVNAMRGATRVLAITQRLYVEFAPEQLEEQGSSVAEFISIACNGFNSAYVLGPQPRFLGAGECAEYLTRFSQQRGRLLNLLFTRDTQADPRLSTYEGGHSSL